MHFFFRCRAVRAPMRLLKLYYFGISYTVDRITDQNNVPVKFERVRAESMGGLLLEVLRQVNDADCLEGALLYANTATDAHFLRNVGELVRGFHRDTLLTCTKKANTRNPTLLILFQMSVRADEASNCYTVVLWQPVLTGENNLHLR